MDEYEDNWWTHCKDEKMWEWRRVREKLGEVTGEREFRSYTAMVYTDDPCLAFCGLKHTREGLILWNDITSALNILMADPHKNQVSQSVKWCGMLFYSSFGVAMIPVSKKVRWQMDLQLAQQTTPVDSTQYRSMLGQTRHYLGVVGGTTHQVPELMKGLWAPYYKGGHFRYKHSWKFKVPDGVRHSLAHIAEMAEQCPGVRWDMLITGGGSATVLTSDYHMYGDASGPEAEYQAMAGYMHGFYWELPVKPEWKHLHITTLEFLCLLGHLLVFGRLLRSGVRVVMHTDAVTSAMKLLGGRGKSEVMEMVRSAICSHPLMNKFRSDLIVQHVWGAANVMADAHSRAYKNVIVTVARQLGVRSIECPVPSEFVLFVDKVARFATTHIRAQDLCFAGLVRTGVVGCKWWLSCYSNHLLR